MLLKKISDFGGEKKKMCFRVLPYNLMLNSGEKKFALCVTKKIIILTRVVRKKNSERKKNHSILPSYGTAGSMVPRVL